MHKPCSRSRGELLGRARDTDEARREIVPAQVLVQVPLSRASQLSDADMGRRIASAIRSIKASLKQRTGDRPMVALVSGEDRVGHFHIAGPPKVRLTEADFGICRQDAELKKRLLF